MQSTASTLAKSGTRNGLGFGVESVESPPFGRAAERLLCRTTDPCLDWTMAPIDVCRRRPQAATPAEASHGQALVRTTERALKRSHRQRTAAIQNCSATLDPSIRPNFVPAPIDVTAPVGEHRKTVTDPREYGRTSR